MCPKCKSEDGKVIAPVYYIGHTEEGDEIHEYKVECSHCGHIRKETRITITDSNPPILNQDAIKRIQEDLNRKEE